MAPKLKKLDDKDKYLALKAKIKLKKAEQSLKNTQPAVIATKVTRAKPNTKLSEKLKRPDVPSQNCTKRRYYVQL